MPKARAATTRQTRSPSQFAVAAASASSQCRGAIALDCRDTSVTSTTAPTTRATAAAGWIAARAPVPYSSARPSAESTPESTITGAAGFRFAPPARNCWNA